MALRPEEIAKTIDHTLLHATATAADVERWCDEALAHHFACVCVLPCYLRLARDRLRGADVKAATVVSFPLGADTTRAKIVAAEEAAAAGADELEVVMNVPALLSGDFRHVRDELAALVRAARAKSTRGVLVKVLVESSVLDQKLARLACKIVEDSGADFAAIGGQNGGARIADVELARECLSEAVGVKASAPLAGVDDLHALVNAGAMRIGTADGVAVVRAAIARRPG